MGLNFYSKIKYLIFIFLIAFSLSGLPKTAYCLTSSSPFGLVFLFPGDSKSLNFELRNVIFGDGSIYPIMVMAVTPDFEIRNVDITINSVGDIGTELMLGSMGFFSSLAAFDLSMLYFEILPPKLFFGNEAANYRVDVNPVVSVGFIITGIVGEYEYFDDYPLYMTITLTMSN